MFEYDEKTIDGRRVQVPRFVDERVAADVADDTPITDRLAETIEWLFSDHP